MFYNEIMTFYVCVVCDKKFKLSFKAIPHKDCRADAQPAFTSDCSKRRGNTDIFQGVLGKNYGKDASVCVAKRAARSLRGVALILIFDQIYNLIKDWYNNPSPQDIARVFSAKYSEKTSANYYMDRF